MKIICFIDDLNAGGAQRQICYLALLFKKKNFDVTILTYHSSNFFAEYLKKNKIKHVIIENKNKLLRLIKIVKYLRSSNQDVLIAYLRTPSLIAEIASLYRKKWKLIVSERNNYKNYFFSNLFRRIMHLVADYVVVNSKTGYSSIKKNAPWLKRVLLIYNFINLNYFKPSKKNHKEYTKIINFIGVGKFTNQKNIINLVKAFNIVKEKKLNRNFTLHWFGDNYTKGKSNIYLNKIRNLISFYNLGDKIFLNQATRNILKKYKNSSALILPSIYEGFPNVACEAISCGLPVLISKVSDNKIFVDHNNGFIFNPNKPNDIAKKISLFCNLNNKEKIKMSNNSRKKAELFFNKNRFLNDYLKIINKI